MDSLLTILIALIGSGVVTVGVTAWFQRQQTKANANKTNAEAAHIKAGTKVIVDDERQEFYDAREVAAAIVRTQLSQARQELRDMVRDEHKRNVEREAELLKDIHALKNEVARLKTLVAPKKKAPRE